MATWHRQPESLKAYQSTREAMGHQFQKDAHMTSVEALHVHNKTKTPNNPTPNNIEPGHKLVEAESEGLQDFIILFLPNEPSSVFSNSRFEEQVIVNNRCYIQPPSTENFAPHKSNKN